jgi:hypothetical protein
MRQEWGRLDGCTDAPLRVTIIVSGQRWDEPASPIRLKKRRLVIVRVRISTNSVAFR